MSDIYLDFRPKGGPELTGKWKGGARTITWPDGNVWSKPLGAAPAIKRTRLEYPKPFMAAVVAMVWQLWRPTLPQDWAARPEADAAPLRGETKDERE